jgi:iron complex outermembrane receptor protein
VNTNNPQNRALNTRAGFAGAVAQKPLLKTWLKGCTALGGALFLASMPQLASAQAAKPAESNALGEVVVTATRVESSAQKTAIAMDVIGSAQLKSEGVTSVTALSAVSPSVNVTGFGGGTVVTIRGISSRDTTEIGDPAVVVSVNGFYQDRSYALGLTQYDLERIEVLRGPQGTLYGRNATGGAINIYTTRPGKSAGGYVQVDGGSFNTLNTEGALNIPLSDRIQMRASFGTNYHSGYRGAGGIFGKVDDSNARSGRLQFAFEPVDNLTINLEAQHTVQTAEGSSPEQIPYRVLASGQIDHSALPALGDTTAYPKAYYSRLNLNDTLYRWDAAYVTPFATFTYLGGYDRLKWDNLAPGYFYNQPATAANPNPAPFQNRVYNQREKPVTVNHEFRINNSNQDDRLTWQAGVFYFKNHNLLDSFNQVPNGTPNPTPVIHFKYDVVIKSLAEMAQISFKVTDSLKLTGGFRHNADDKSRSGNIFFSAALPPGAVPTTTIGSVKKDTFHLGADYQINPNSLLYAKYDTGYKSGGFTDIAPYGPESVKTVEVGSKNRFWDNRIQFNIDAYRSDYTGQQVQQIVSGGGGLRIVNAGASRLWGVEGDLTAALDFGRVELNVAYLNAKFTDFALAYAAPIFNGAAFVSAPTVNLQLAGNHPQQAPEWTIGAAFEHSEEAFGGRLTGRISTKYQSTQYYTFFNRPDDTQKANAISNLLLTYAPNNASWQLQAYMNNFTNNTVFSNAGPNDRNFDYAYSFQPPRTYGVRASYKW